MTEFDLGLKMLSRRMLWRMGFSTRIDVSLRAVSRAPTGGERAANAPESFTDLDVLGIAVAPSGQVRSSIVDCKTGGSSSISRMFWVKGLQDFFEADDAYLVRERSISNDARQLAHRLGLTAMTGEEAKLVETLHPVLLPIDESPLRFLFDTGYMTKVMKRWTSLDRKLDPLLEYRQFDYWVHPEHQNLMKMIDSLRSVAKVLDPGSPIHTGIVLDCAWLYLLSVSHALRAIRTVHVSDLNYGLSEYLAGGAVQLRQKRDVSKLLAELQEDKRIPATVSVDANPVYFPALLELLTRLLRRNYLLTDMLRMLEFQSTAAVGGDRVSSEEAFGASFDRVVAKLSVDVVSFLVTASGIEPAFIDTASALLLGASPLAGISPGSEEGQHSSEHLAQGSAGPPLFEV